MKKDFRIYVAGHCGLVGSAILQKLITAVHTNLLTRTHAEQDLTDQKAVQSFFRTKEPEFVFMAAARVGV